MASIRSLPILPSRADNAVRINTFALLVGWVERSETQQIKPSRE